MSVVTLRRGFYVGALTLAAAGFMLILGERAARPDHGNASSAVNAKYTAVGEGNLKTIGYKLPGSDRVTVHNKYTIHRTYWECQGQGKKNVGLMETYLLICRVHNRCGLVAQTMNADTP